MENDQPVTAKEIKPRIFLGPSSLGCFILLLLLFFTPLGLVLIPFGQIWCSSCNRTQLWWSRAHYDEVVRQIDKDFPNPTERTTREIRGTRVHFQRDSNGRLIVWLPAFDMGHAGNWYKLYCNPPLSAREVEMWISPGTGTQVDAHWWAVNGSD